MGTNASSNKHSLLAEALVSRNAAVALRLRQELHRPRLSLLMLPRRRSLPRSSPKCGVYHTGRRLSPLSPPKGGAHHTSSQPEPNPLPIILQGLPWQRRRLAPLAPGSSARPSHPHHGTRRPRELLASASVLWPPSTPTHLNYPYDARLSRQELAVNTGLPTSVNCLPSHPTLVFLRREITRTIVRPGYFRATHTVICRGPTTSSAVSLPSACPYSLGSRSSCQGSDGSATPSTRLAFADRLCHVRTTAPVMTDQARARRLASAPHFKV